jgi:hypothetical protein
MMTPTEYEPKELLRMSAVQRCACAASVVFAVVLVGIPIHLGRNAGVPISFWLIVTLAPLGRLAWQLTQRASSPRPPPV